VAYVVVTHVHLDHAGGAGALLRELPAARLVVHPRGARHLVDPTRLVEGARVVFGERLERFWGLPVPVPEERLLVPEDGGRLRLGGGHTLRFLDAPGHARHQYAVLDEGTGHLYAGDELGVRYPWLGTPERDYVFANTAPNQFDPEVMARSVARLRDLRPEAVLLTHFGAARMPIAELAERVARQARQFAALGEGEPPPDWREVRRRLVELFRRDMEEAGLPWSEETARLLEVDFDICAHGIAEYHRRRAAGA
jgi:glyoxylase-like metal-dependent hydrolase (beta-lactamase superfamily II)